MVLDLHDLETHAITCSITHKSCHKSCDLSESIEPMGLYILFITAGICCCKTRPGTTSIRPGRRAVPLPLPVRIEPTPHTALSRSQSITSRPPRHHGSPFARTACGAGDRGGERWPATMLGMRWVGRAGSFCWLGAWLLAVLVECSGARRKTSSHST